MSNDKATIKSAAQALINYLESGRMYENYGGVNYNGKDHNSEGFFLKEALKKALQEE
jgi:hypothetical protein